MNFLQNSLAHPPYGISSKLKTTRLVELMAGTYHSVTTGCNKFFLRQSLANILLCYSLDKNRTEFCQFVLRIRVALLDEVDKTQSLIVVDDRLLFTVCCRIVVHHIFNDFSCRAKFTLFF